MATKTMIKCRGCGKEIEVTLNPDGTPNRKDCKECAFKRLATYRVNKILKDFELLENLSSSQYQKTDEQISKIKRVITEKMQKALSAIEGTKTVTKDTFTL
jgi:DNA-directed RNA polymerase subunit RPC12/RpoP